MIVQHCEIQNSLPNSRTSSHFNINMDHSKTEEEDLTSQSTDFEFDCCFCEDVFVTESELQHHYEVVHPKSCDLCKISDCINDNPRNKFACEVCAKNYKHKSSLKRHLEINHNICDICTHFQEIDDF
jgi:transcription elongation factor Elf1